ncbi:hypothetical protein EC991_009883 [Linnemannia zychae]|nr:hypothetical protein EC991_009883 [Linnemannia zychae]
MENSTDRIMRAHYVDETVFVHGIFWPNHFTHWLYNGMLPLYSTMKRFGGTKNSWLLKLNSEFFNYDIQYQGEWEMRHFFHTGLELVLREEEVATDFQTLPPSDAPICFSRAVIGLGSQCALGYCVKNIPWEIYHSFRDYLADFYWRTPQIWQRHIRTTMDLIAAAQPNKQQEQQEQQKQQSTPLKCLDLARYYNFEPSTGADPLVPLKESKSRVGHHSPDTVDPEVVTTSNGRRKLVVAMIQREGTRRVINDQELVESLASAGFRVKWITFDHGCGLAETAYLLRDVHVLATPHGNAIGTSVFMPTTNPVPTIITLDASRYSENWFINTVTALGQRFIQSVCGPHAYVDAATKARCPYYRDEALAHKALGIWGADIVLGLSDELAQSYKAKAAQQNLTGEAIHEFRDYVNCTPSAQRLAKQELELLLGPEYPAALVAKYDADIMDYFIEVFWRDSPRYADVPRVVALVQELQKDQEKEQAAAALGQQRPELQYQQYLNYLRQSRACGVKYCKRIIKRNVISELRAFGVHSIDDLGRWGQSAVNETIFQGLEDVPNWIPEALVPNNLSI